MPADAPNPYESTQHSSLPRAKLIRGKEWSFTLDGSPHRVVLNHSSGGMQTSFYVDDVLQFKSGGMLEGSAEPKNIPFQIENHRLLITIRPAIFGSDYSLYIDDVLYDGPGEDPARKARQKQISEIIFGTVIVLGTLLFSFSAESKTKYYGPMRLDWIFLVVSLVAFLWLAENVYRFLRSRT